MFSPSKGPSLHTSLAVATLRDRAYMDMMKENQELKALCKRLMLVEVKTCHHINDGKKLIETVVGTATLDRGNYFKNQDGVFWSLRVSNKKEGTTLSKFPQHVRVYVGGQRVLEIMPRGYANVAINGPREEQFQNERNVFVPLGTGHVFCFSYGLPPDRHHLYCRDWSQLPSNTRVNQFTIYFPFWVIKPQLEILGVDPHKQPSEDDDDDDEL